MSVGEIRVSGARALLVQIYLYLGIKEIHRNENMHPLLYVTKFKNKCGKFFQNRNRKLNLLWEKRIVVQRFIVWKNVIAQQYLFVCLVVLTSGYWCRHRYKVPISHSRPCKIFVSSTSIPLKFDRSH